MSEFTFDRETQSLLATRDFMHGTLQGEKGKPVDFSDLPDASIEHLVLVAEVVEVVSPTKGKAGTVDPVDKP